MRVGKEPFLSPYVNLANRGSTNGTYVTPNRQTEFSTRLYASGAESMALHGGDADLSSILRLNQSNNAGSFLQAGSHDTMMNKEAMNGYALASSKPLVGTSML